MKRKSIIVAGMLLALSISTVACSGNKASDANTVAETTAVAAESTTEKADESSSETAQEGVYVIYNKTGEIVTAITITDKEDNKVVAQSEDLKDGDNVKLTIAADGDMNSKEYALEFTTEGGYNAIYGTLRFESVPITLLASDAMTGPTPIAFEIPEN